MSQLPDDGRELLEAARQQHEPDDADRARVRAQLAVKLAALGAGSATVAAGKAAAAATQTAAGAGAGAVGSAGLLGSVAAKLIVVAIVGSVGAGVTWKAMSTKVAARGASPRSGSTIASAARPAQKAPSAPLAALPAPQATSDAGTAVLESAPPAVPSATSTPNRPISPPRSVARSRSGSSAPLAPTLSARIESTPEASEGRSALDAEAAAPDSPATNIDAEIELVARARDALRSGDANASLAALDEHATKFPEGVLAEEATALRVRALCAAGRPAEARVVADDFFARWPRSLQAAGVRAGCTTSKEQP